MSKYCIFYIPYSSFHLAKQKKYLASYNHIRVHVPQNPNNRKKQLCFNVFIFLSGTTKNCKQETQKEYVRDLEWATTNCTLAFTSVGNDTRFILFQFCI